MWSFGRKSSVRKFWEWFVANQSRFRDLEHMEESALDELGSRLRAVDPGLVFEFGAGEGKTEELVISADGVKGVFPIVFEVVNSAPAIPGWKITPFRQPGKINVVIEMYGHTLGPDDLWFSAEPDGAKTGLVVFVRGLSEANRKQLTPAVFILLDNALGEFVVETSISYIELQPLPEAPETCGLIRFLELPRAVKPVLQ